MYAFGNCTNLSSVTFENKNDWKVSKNSNMSSSTSVSSLLSSPSYNAQLLKSTYSSYYWARYKTSGSGSGGGIW